MKATNFIYAIFALALIVSCGSRKVDKKKLSIVEQMEIRKKEIIDSMSNVKRIDSISINKDSVMSKTSTTEKLTIDKIFNIDIKPSIPGSTSMFDLMINGQRVQGQTDALISITNQHKIDSVKSVVSDYINNKAQIVAVKKAEEVVNKHKATDSDIKADTKTDIVDTNIDKKEPWIFNLSVVALIAGIAIAIVIAAIVIYKKYKAAKNVLP